MIVEYSLNGTDDGMMSLEKGWIWWIPIHSSNTLVELITDMIAMFDRNILLEISK